MSPMRLASLGSLLRGKLSGTCRWGRWRSTGDSRIEFSAYKDSYVCITSLRLLYYIGFLLIAPHVCTLHFGKNVNCGVLLDI